MDKKRFIFESKLPQVAIEKQANSQEHPTLLLLSRFKNFEIYEQLSNLYEKYYNHIDYHNHTSVSLKDLIQHNLNQRIKAVESDTPIELDPEGEGNHGGHNFGLIQWSDISRESIQTPFAFDDSRVDPSKSIQIQSIIESHEKGHVVRSFEDKFFRDYFAGGFDLNANIFSRERIKELCEKYNEETPSEEDIDTIIKEGIEYLFSGYEIAERMSQLKSYFGMKGNEKFTPEHLSYAREHYISDTGLNNNMDQFFSAITKETEPKFIELINTSGI